MNKNKTFIELNYELLRWLREGGFLPRQIRGDAAGGSGASAAEGAGGGGGLERRVGGIVLDHRGEGGGVGEVDVGSIVRLGLLHRGENWSCGGGGIRGGGALAGVGGGGRGGGVRHKRKSDESIKGSSSSSSL